MVSRIDIGPDGGPYVAINENSNDLELQDINGNVIAVWDETEGQWDLNNNSLTNIDTIYAASAEVADGFNSEIADNVDYLDPRWMARSDMWLWQENFESFDGLQQTTSGSASIDYRNSLEPRLETGSTNGSVAKVASGKPAETSLSLFTWDKDGTMRYGVRLLETSNVTWYATTGDYQSQSEGLGFKFEDGDLFAVAGGSSGSTEENIITDLSGDNQVLKINWTSGQQAEYYVNGTKETTISTNLPSGTRFKPSKNNLVFRLENSEAANKRLFVGGGRVVMV